jgi:hypothetical protein
MCPGTEQAEGHAQSGENSRIRTIDPLPLPDFRRPLAARRRDGRPFDTPIVNRQRSDGEASPTSASTIRRPDGGPPDRRAS